MPRSSATLRRLGAWTSSARRTSSSQDCRTTRSRRTGSTSTACGCTTSTRGAARPSCCSTASRRGRFSGGTSSRRSSASGRRAIAPDLIGFGRSDKPTDQGWYTYDRHVETVTRLVSELDLRDIALVVHDWGGLIGLRFAVENAERVERLVILDTGVWSGRAPSETWLRFREAVRSVGGELDIARLVESGTQRGLSRRDPRRLQRPVPDAGVESGRARVPGARPRRARPPDRGGTRARPRRPGRAGTNRRTSSGAPRTPSCRRRSPSASSR